MEVKREKETFGRGRRFLIGVNVVLMIAVALVLAPGLLYVLYRPEVRVRLDLTEEQKFSLSDKTKDVLKALEQPVQIIGVFRPTDFDRDTNGFVLGFGAVIQQVALRTHDFLREYRIASDGLVEPEILDPSNPRDLKRIKEVKESYKSEDNRLVIVCGNRRKVLNLDDLAEIDRGNANPESLRASRLVGFHGEQALTSTIIELTEVQAPVAYFLTGHGEKDPLQGTGTAFGLEYFAKALQDDGFEMRNLSLRPGDDVPSDATLLAILAPQKAIPESEIETIRAYLQRGGRMFLALDPKTPVALLDSQILHELYGILVKRGIVVALDQGGGAFADPTKLYLDSYGDARAVTYHKSRQIKTLYQDATSFETLEVVPKGVRIGHLVWTPREAWADNLNDESETRVQDRGELSGAQRIALQAEGGQDAPGSRVVVFGDSDFLTNGLVAQGPGNRDLAVNCFEWLAGREQLISIAPKTIRDRRLDFTESEYETMFYSIVMFMPLAAAALGLVVWRMRCR